MNTLNAVTRRLDYLESLWEEFRENPDSRICRWVVQQDEYALVDSFFQVSAAEHSDTPDIFLRFETIFEDTASFGKMLSDELSSFVEEDRAALAEEGIEIPWQSEHINDNKNTALGFLRNLFHFTLSLDLEEDELLVAFIAPVTIQNRKSWQKWWSDAATLEIPPQIRLMVCDVQGDIQLESVANKQPTKLTSIQPKLDAPGMMRELMSEYGDQEDGCTHFRKAFFELTQSVGKRDTNSIRQNAAKALELARQIGYPHLEVAVLCTAATGFVSAGQLELGIRNYDEAKRIAKAAEPLPIIKEMPELKVDLPGGNLFTQLGIQTLFFKGAALIGVEQFDRALETYQQAANELRILIVSKGNPQQADWSNGGILLFHRIEALRMSGYCQQRLKRDQESLESYHAALRIAEALDAETRKSTMIAFAGKAMLDIYQKRAMKQEYHQISEKMNGLLGADWEQTLPKRAA